MLSFLFAKYKSLPPDEESSLPADKKRICRKFFKKFERKVRKIAAVEHRLREKALPFHRVVHSIGTKRSQNVTA